MKKRMRMLSLLLTATMVFSTVSVPAWADDIDLPVEQEEEGETQHAVSLNMTEVTLGISETAELTATTTPEDLFVTYESSDPSVASVNPSTGVVTGVAAGTATITVSLDVDPTVTASCTVTVEGLTPISCGDDIYYTLSEDGVLTIFGDGTMTDYYNDWFAPDPGWASSRNSIKKIVIEEGVTAISGAAFGFMWTYPNVEEIEIPSSVESLGAYAFGGCSNLQKVTIGRTAPLTETNALPNKELTVMCQAGTTGIDTGIWTNDNYTIEGILTSEVRVSAQAEGAYMLPISIMEVQSNLAESYGYADTITDSVSALDVLVAETIEAFGEDYTVETKDDYLAVSDSGWITTVFGEVTGAFSFRVNQEMVMTLINATPVTDEDDIQFYLYTDRTYYTDRYTYLSVDSEVTAGTSVEVYATYEGYDSNWNTVLLPLEGASIGVLDMETGLVTEIEGCVTDEDGKVEITFNEAGDYYITAYGTDDTDSQLIMNPLKVTVAEAEEIYTAEVTVSTQAEGAYMLPIATMTVQSDLAESYGYADTVTDSVSALDVLVAETIEVFGEAYTAETKDDYLAISDSGWITTVFGEETGAFSFRVNQEMVMTLINATPVTDEDDIQFYLYTDRTYYTDRYTYLSVDGEVTAGTSVEVYATYEGYDSNWNTVLLPLEGASIGVLDMETGLVTEIEDCVTDEDGKVEITFHEAGDYYLTAYGTDDTDSQLIMNPLKVTVEAPAVVEIITEPENTNAAIGESASYTVEAVNAASYQWYYTKNGSKWYKSTANGNDTDTLTIKVSSTNMDNQYTCKVTGADGTVLYSEVARNEITDTALAITAQPENFDISYGTDAWFSVEADNAASYQWYYSKDGGEKWYKSSITTTEGENKEYSAINLTVSKSNLNNVYRCKVTGIDGTSLYSDQVGFTGIPVITKQPESVISGEASTATFSVEAEGAEEITYQWYYSVDGGNTWYKSNSKGATSAALTVKQYPDRCYRCKVTANGFSVYSEVAGYIA